MDITIIIAVISLLVSGVTLYLAQLRPPKLISKSGPYVQVYYADFKSGGSFGLYLPVSIINKSTITGAALKAAITLSRKDTPDKTFFMQWHEFEKLSVKEKESKWIYEEMAHALAIPGNSAIKKIIWFVWEVQSQPKLVLQQGIYIMNFYFWDEDHKLPNCETHEFFVDDSIFTELDNHLKAEDDTTVNIVLDTEMKENAILTEHERRNLLG